MTQQLLDRRTFVGTAAAGLTLMGARAADTPRRVALVGSGWYGKNDLFRLVQVEDVEIVALCDPDSKSLAADAKTASKRHKSGKAPRTYGDYRELLKQEQPDIVEVATPDHWHCLPAIEAMQAGADVYVQKPISVDVVEGQSMVAAARKYGRVVQVGTQRRSAPHLIEARDRIQSGMLGKISHAEVCCYVYRSPRGNPPDTDPPAHLDYEMWTGPAPMRPYNELVHPRRWRAFMEYGNGIMGDMCVHMLDAVRWMTGLGWPERVSSSGGIQIQKASKANIADSQVATFEYDQFPVVWTHRSWGTAPDPAYPWAFFIYGSKGTLKGSVHGWDFVPVDKNAKPLQGRNKTEVDQYPEDKTEPDLELHSAHAVRYHMKDWLQAVDERSRPVADIEEGHKSTTACILANMAMQLGRSLEWDAERGEVRNDGEANRLLARPYRKPWKHPDPANV
jgi:predicted dehydrogenase